MTADNIRNTTIPNVVDPTNNDCLQFIAAMTQEIAAQLAEHNAMMDRFMYLMDSIVSISNYGSGLRIQ